MHEAVSSLAPLVHPTIGSDSHGKLKGHSPQVGRGQPQRPWEEWPTSLCSLSQAPRNGPCA
jgi:hypothetical protein